MCGRSSPSLLLSHGSQPSTVTGVVTPREPVTRLAECTQAGMNDHIAKPIIVRDLLTKIAQWAGGPEGDPAVLSG